MFSILALFNENNLQWEHSSDTKETEKKVLMYILLLRSEGSRDYFYWTEIEMESFVTVNNKDKQQKFSKLCYDYILRRDGRKEMLLFMTARKGDA